MSLRTLDPVEGPYVRITNLATERPMSTQDAAPASANATAPGRPS
jgi:hypothetical protein